MMNLQHSLFYISKIPITTTLDIIHIKEIKTLKIDRLYVMYHSSFLFKLKIINFSNFISFNIYIYIYYTI